MLRIIVCLLGAILLLATLTGVSTMVQENREAVSMEKTAQTIDIMRRVLARSISREIAEILQTPYTTVRSRLVQGLNELRLKLRNLNPCACS